MADGYSLRGRSGWKGKGDELGSVKRAAAVGVAGEAEAARRLARELIFAIQRQLFNSATKRKLQELEARWGNPIGIYRSGPDNDWCAISRNAASLSARTGRQISTDLFGCTPNCSISNLITASIETR